MTTRTAAGLVSVALWAACGGGSDGSPDAAAPAPDAAADAVPVGAVHVMTYTRCCTEPPKLPAAGIAIHVIAPDGTLAATVTTGADGTATLDGVTAGSAVMMVYPQGMFNPPYVTTVLGVEPGDALVFGDDYNLAPGSGSGRSFEVTYPPIAAAQIAAYLPCHASYGLGPSPAEVYLDGSCESTHATVPIFATDSGNQLVGSAVLRDVTLADGAGFTVAAWSPPVVQTVRVAVPAAIDDTDLGLVWRYGKSRTEDWHTATGAGGIATATFASPVDPDLVTAIAMLHRDGFGGQTHSQTTPPGAATIDVELTDLPWLGDKLTSVADRRIQWLQDGDGGDGLFVHLLYKHHEPDGTSYDVEWNLIAPAGTRELDWAALPAELPAPRDGDELIASELTLIDVSNAASYGELRRYPEWELRCPDCAVNGGDASAAHTSTAAGNN